MEKICSKCKVPKDETDFYFANRSKGTLKSRCKACSSEDQRATPEQNLEKSRRYRAKNKSKINARSVARRKENLEKYKAWERASYQRNKEKMKQRRREKEYGLSPIDFDAMFVAQGRSCAICKITDPGERDFHTDHDREYEKLTGDIKVRGILCQNCNLALGLLHDNPATLRAAACYLEIIR